MGGPPPLPGRERRALIGAAFCCLVACDAGRPPAPDAEVDEVVSDTDADTADASPDTAPEDGTQPATDTSAPPSTARIPSNTVPCEAPAFWPYSVATSVAGHLATVRVHYRAAAEEPTALDVLGLAAVSLPRQLDVLGFRLPPSDGGRCGPDEAIDIFLWRDAPMTYTDLVSEARDTPWDDGPPYVVLDAFGELGGRYLASTVTHELSHVLQAADSWYDAPIAYEMTAMYVEDVLHDEDDNYLELIEDYQRRPDRSVDWDDGYETFFMYGSCIFLQYLEARFFQDDPAFIGRVWHGMRNHPDENEPDFLDALDAVLAPHGRGFADTVLEFARWRWYTGRRDDGRHLPEAGAHPAEAEVPLWASLSLGAEDAYVDLRPMLFGTHFIALDGDEGTRWEVEVGGDPTVQWVAQVLPAPAETVDGEDGAFLLQDRGSATLRLPRAGLTLAVTALPGPSVDPDPDRREDTRYRGSLAVTRSR